MRWLVTSLLFTAVPASAQVVLPAPPAGSIVYAPGTQAWSPVADYITAGQDEPGYRNWYAATPTHATAVKSFNAYLQQYEVGGIFPTWQLLRTATSWQKCGGQPFEVPPTSEWPHIVQTLRYVRDYVIPAVGPVEPVSAYRNPSLNVCARGAPTSTHLTGGAIDMVPSKPTTREYLMETLCRIHLKDGGWNNIGLGFYKGVRFHIDATKNREWGTAGKAGGFGCEAVLREGAMPYVAPAVGPLVPPNR